MSQFSTSSGNTTEKASILSKIRNKHPDRVPVLINRKEKSNLPQPANSK